MNLEIIIPNKEILEKYNNLVKSILKKIKNNSEEIQELEKSRDLILPRLMRGEVLV
jgi:type I restriction enzyme S subunit